MAVTINASTSAGLVQTADTSGVLQLQTANTTAVNVDASQNVTVAGNTYLATSSGNVGVGTTNPSPKITVAKTASTSVTNASYYLGLGGTENLLDSKRLIGMGYSSGSTDEYPTAMGYVETSNGGFTNGAIAFYTRSVTTNTAPSERMRIDSSGNVLVNQTANTYNGKLAMSHDSSVDDGLVIRDTRGSGSSNQVSFIYNTTQVGRILTTSSATSYITSSDYRLKENIVPMTGALDKVALLKPVIYKWKVDGSDGQGFIAHELAEVVPDCVSGEKDAVDEEGNIKPQGVDTSFLVATLTAAIQEQQTIINDLKARIETLEGAA